jgi:signal recognition particle receptor subunit beta
MSLNYFNTVLFFILKPYDRQKVDGVVLIGCSGGGKTVITHRLVCGKIPDTVSSMAPSFNDVKLPSGKKVQVVDFPGHERLRESMFEHIKGAKGLVLVVDPRTSKGIKQTALLIYELFKSPNFSTTTPLLVTSKRHIPSLFHPCHSLV